MLESFLSVSIVFILILVVLIVLMFYKLLVRIRQMSCAHTNWILLEERNIIPSWRKRVCAACGLVEEIAHLGPLSTMDG